MRKALLAGVAIASLGIGWKVVSRADDDAAASDKSLVLDRLWVDHLPENPRDVFHVFVAMSDEPFGIFQATSVWKGEYELFTFENVGDELRIIYGQTNAKEKVKATARECKEKEMDFCLELKGASRGVKKYYSLEGWETNGSLTVEQLRAKIAALVPAEGAR